MIKGLTRFNIISLTLGYAFIYIPIILVILYSFNKSHLVTVWSGFSVKWYGVLFKDDAMLHAAWITLEIAVSAATISVILGTLAGFALVRFPRFSGRNLFTGMIYAPLVMPDVIIGISLLLLFVSLHWKRGLVTVIIAHTSFCISYVAVVVQSHLITVDRSIEEAALDLGATPTKTFFAITLPMIAPALVASWLLSFTMSVDNLVISAFTTGPGANTLPIKIYSAMRMGITPEINALSTIMLFVVAVGATIALIIKKRHSMERQRAERMALAEQG